MYESLHTKYSVLKYFGQKETRERTLQSDFKTGVGLQHTVLELNIVC